jgi:2,4-dienoyl-CoA reductase-like NADH-dependent reductase (Old Yellow Enzyme family)
MTPAQKIPVGPSYQVPHARAVKAATNLPTVAVGLIAGYDQAEAIVGTGDADFVALARGKFKRALEIGMRGPVWVLVV